ncbi:WYL domain-containing protein [Nocardia alni]|uniref:WYL domain-containing protein n=1 Tax=Nocardia alni TaxID=2815723 RepID=UPI001C23A16F|nr:WYL domain-containing protein [Nocardia alni]
MCRSGGLGHEGGYRLLGGFRDPIGYWRKYLSEFDERRLSETATLRVSPLVFEGLPRYFEPALVGAVQDSAGEPDAEGWREIALPIGSAEWSLPEILRLGSGAEVMGPKELRDRIAGHTAEMASRYRR